MRPILRWTCGPPRGIRLKLQGLKLLQCCRLRPVLLGVIRTEKKASRNPTEPVLEIFDVSMSNTGLSWTGAGPDLQAKRLADGRFFGGQES